MHLYLGKSTFSRTRSYSFSSERKAMIQKNVHLNIMVKEDLMVVGIQDLIQGTTTHQEGEGEQQT